MTDAVTAPPADHATSRPIIEMQGVNKWYDSFQVLTDIHLSVRTGERIVICGPSGSGKSTLIRCINRLETVQKGRIEVDGIDLTAGGKNVDAVRAEVSLSSFGAAEVGRHGQLWCTELAQRAGADGVEVRGEMLRDPATELAALAGRAAVYSSPEGLWAMDGVLDEAALQRGQHAARAVGAPRLKMAIGGFGAGSHASLARLKALLQGQPVELLIENDQTATAGTLAAMQTFFDAQERAGLDLGMTFDMGNWHWQGECPLQAAQALAHRVRYVHCKGVQRSPAKWVAVPLMESVAPWRAVLRALPADVPHAIEYPLIGDDLVAVTRAQLAVIRDARSLG